MKRKVKAGVSNEPKNLKRFRSELNQFSKEHSSEWQLIQGKSGVRQLLKPGKGPSRKQRRKEERKLKKMRKLAFKQKKPLPTKEILESEKKAAAKAEKLKKIKEKRKIEKNAKKVKLREKQKDETDVRKLGLLEANKAEERTIKQLEKQLRLNKRKNKSLPISFKNDGLDYILSAVDTGLVKGLYDPDEDMSDEDIPKSSWDIDEEESGEDDKSKEEDSDEEEKSDEEVSDDEDSGQSSEDDSEHDTFQHPEQESDVIKPKSGILKTTKAQGSKVSSGSSSKSVQFDKEPFKTKEKFKVKVKSTGCMESSDSSEIGSEEEMIVGRKEKQVEWLKSSSRHQAKAQEFSSDEEVGSEELENDSEDDIHRDVALREDIYGRLRDEKGNVISKEGSGVYVPPAKRQQLATSGDVKKQLVELERLKKQLKGLLNRLSESNIQPVSSQIEDMYRENSRMEMTELLAELIMESCISTVLIHERLIMEHAMLIAILHGNVAVDVGAYFIQLLARKFDSEFQKTDLGGTKEVDNVVVLLANLYNFKIFHSNLIFDILKKLADSFREKDIELLLLLLKSVGFTLRKDDPVTLKELIVKIQQKAAGTNTEQFEDRSRVQFMIDVLLAIKNNNMRKIPNYDPTHIEHLRKVIRNYVKGGSTGEQLRVSLNDLLRSDQRGRWWVVGSAWSGPDNEDETAGCSVKSVEGQVSSHILELAREQRMNTDVRRTIFCIIMTCEDFVDAFEKLLQLGLKNQQEREIIHVVTELCLQEKSFNPFYAYLTQKFCEHDRRFQMTTQFSMWDKFKELQGYSEQKLNNLAAYLTHLLAVKALSLSIFKVIEFAELDKPRVRLMKRVLGSLLLDQPEHVMRDVFLRIATVPKLHLLREGLKLFMRHFLLRGSKRSNPEDRVTLEERVNVAEKMLTAGDSRLML